MLSSLISIAYAKIQVTPKTTAIDNVLRIFFRDETFFVLHERKWEREHDWLGFCWLMSSLPVFSATYIPCSLNNVLSYLMSPWQSVTRLSVLKYFNAHFKAQTNHSFCTAQEISWGSNRVFFFFLRMGLWLIITKRSASEEILSVREAGMPRNFLCLGLYGNKVFRSSLIPPSHGKPVPESGLNYVTYYGQESKPETRKQSITHGVCRLLLLLRPLTVLVTEQGAGLFRTRLPC